MSMSANIHDGEEIKLKANLLNGRDPCAIFRFTVTTRDYRAHESSAEITVFMSDLACLDKLQRAADAFNAIMAETVPAPSEYEAA